MKKINQLKKDQLKYTIIVSLIIIVVIIIGFYKENKTIYEGIYPLIQDETENKENQDDIAKEKLIKTAQELLERYNITYSENGVKKYVLYEDKELNIKNLPQKYLKETALKQFTNKDRFKRDDLEETIKKLYGNKLAITNKDFVTSDCQKYAYNQTTTVYENKGRVSCDMGNKNESLAIKFLDVKKKKKDILVNVAVAIVNNDSKEIELPTGKVIENLNADTFDIEKDYDKVSEYQYTFAYSKEEKDYYLKSIKRIKPTIKRIKTINIKNQSEQVQELYNIITKDFERNKYFYQGKEIKVEEMDNMVKLFMIYQAEGNADDINIENNYGKIYSKMSKVSFDEKYLKFFGEDPVKYTLEDYSNFDIKPCSAILYDYKTNNYYSFGGECGGTYMFRFKINLYSIEEENNKLNISLKVMILSEDYNNNKDEYKINDKYNLYLDVANTILLKEYTNIDANDTDEFFEEIYEDIPIYTFSFEKQENGNYNLKTIFPNN